MTRCKPNLRGLPLKPNAFEHKIWKDSQYLQTKDADATHALRMLELKPTKLQEGDTGGHTSASFYPCFNAESSPPLALAVPLDLARNRLGTGGRGGGMMMVKEMSN